MQKLLFLCFGLLLSLPVSAQDHNTGFEKWHPALRISRMTEDPGTPGCYRTMIGDIIATGEHLAPDSILTGWSAVRYGITRTNDAHSGQYAAMVHMWYNGSPSVLCLGKSNDPGNYISKVHLDRKLYGVSGYYKYIVDSLGPNDTYRKVTMLHIRTYKTNTVTGESELLHHDSLTFSRSDAYREFYLPVTYTDSDIIPDSVSIWFESKGYWSGTTICMLSHFLYLDDLVFRYAPYTLPVQEHRPPGKKKVSISPNPATGNAHLQYDKDMRIRSIQLLDHSGRTIRRFSPDNTCLDLEGLEQGMYILYIATQQGSTCEKIIIE
ncbi:MAG: hypothetical protein BGO09_16290 [Bacteroidetes bacterium 47-18]|nr:MAG: hypothetical protein BGO09_16290 [Bacteroidetes bacterium 47-18]